ncbi:MAG: DNA gyrase inhibitor YacG [Burkholderiaceae bacterium]|jgi:endogenous inhibitor of DNA gyrase (YacG/DUF329 family)|nr:MAG: DNA gyrase inhibitor YacG [Burkholderiaceae bacterium]
MTVTAKTRTVRCPTCGGPSRFDASNPYRPFCSKRCKLQDLGAWASESYRVDAAERSDTTGKPTDPDSGRHESA